jgi:hypothetical protein
MKSGFNKMEIEQIIFETGDQEVLLNANVVKGNLSYRSQLILNFTDLNLLLNKIQGQIGDNEEVSSLFDIEKMYNGNLLYTLDIEKKLDQTILLDSIEFNHEIKQIRA